MTRGSPPHSTLAERILAHSAASPDAVAVRGDRDLTYGVLAARSALIADAILKAAAGKKAPVVAVALPRGTDLVVTVLAVLRLGGVYLPVGTELPHSRLASIVADARPDVVLSAGAPHPAFGNIPAVDPRAAEAAARVNADVDPGQDTGVGDGPADVDPAEFRYLLYTSGSTGQPKGVLSGHAGLLNRLAWMEREFALGPGDRVLHKTPVTFDVSLWELISPLLAGATVVLAKPGGHLDGRYLHTLITQQGVTVLHFVPSMLAAYARANQQGPVLAAESVRLVAASGEALSPGLARTARELFPNAQVYNLYGPTEASIDVTYHRVRDAELTGTTVPIGRAITGIDTHVIGEDGRPAEPGEPGELWLTGVGLAHGYLNRPQETAAAFVTDPPFLPAARAYRTGDLVRENGDGDLEYLGRKDRQIKFRGVRIELTELEDALDRYPGVSASRVCDDGDRLVAVVQPEDLPDHFDGPVGGREASFVPGAADRTVPSVFRWRELAAELREHLAVLLPASMLPTHFLFVTDWPVTGHGKLDVAELARRIAPFTAPDASAALDAQASDGVAAGGTIVEQVLKIFRSVLGSEDITASDSFFDVGGGNSLTATAAAHRVEEYVLDEFSLDISGEASLFVRPTAKELAGDIEARLPRRP